MNVNPKTDVTGQTVTVCSFCWSGSALLYSPVHLSGYDVTMDS